MTQSTNAANTTAALAPPPRGEKRQSTSRVSRPRSGVWWRHALALVALAWALFPVLYILSAALNPAGTLSATSPLPQHFSMKNFTDLFSSTAFPFWTWFRNSLIVAGLGTIFQVFIGALAAYAFSRLRWAGRRPGLMALLLAQMFPVMLAFPALYIMFCASVTSSRRSG